MEIVPYDKSYHKQLVEIWSGAVRRTHNFLSDEDFAFFHRIVDREALKAVEVWVAMQPGSIPAGFIGLDGAKIEMLFVSPEYHGRGIGRRLIRHARELKGAVLQVDVNEQNEGGCRFYQRLGFVRTGRSELDGSGKPYPLLHMEYTEM
jgi:putative acetyltransferase